MRYFKLVTYISGGKDYETQEKLIDEPMFRSYQRAIIDGKELLVLEDRVIKLSSIKEILPADDIVAEHLKQGLNLKTLGLPERDLLPEGEKERLSFLDKI